MADLLIAHFGGGHAWEWAIYAVPFVSLFVMLMFERRRERREAQEESEGSEEEEIDDQL